MKKKLLLIGGSAADIPIINAAHHLNYFVITTGNNPNDLGHQYADEFHCADYSKPEDILILAKNLNIDAVCASSNDFSALAAAYVSEHLNLTGYDKYETSKIIHHKDKFREFSLSNGISVPLAYTVSKTSSLENLSLSYPMIVKPVDLSGGKGITKVNSKAELSNAVESAFGSSKSSTIVIEEFIEGSNHGYSTFIKDGKVAFFFMDDEHYFNNPYLVSGASTSQKYTKEISSFLNTQLELIASKLDLVNGLLHAQFILRGNIPYIIEICRRTPGDLYVLLVEYATGFNMSQSIVTSAVGKPVNIIKNEKISYITRHCVMSSKNGYIKHLNYGKFSTKIFYKMTFYKKGDYIKDCSVYKAEIDFIRYKNKNIMYHDIKVLEQEIILELEE